MPNGHGLLCTDVMIDKSVSVGEDVDVLPIGPPIDGNRQHDADRETSTSDDLVLNSDRTSVLLNDVRVQTEPDNTDVEFRRMAKINENQPMTHSQKENQTDFVIAHAETRFQFVTLV